MFLCYWINVCLYWSGWLLYMSNVKSYFVKYDCILHVLYNIAS